MDYACGVKAYDGHRSVDILLRNFQVQDSGVAVLAAAPGVVAAMADGMPDRNTSWDAGGGFGNHVVLAHERGVRTVYAHLRRNSVAVRPGETVEAGDAGEWNVRVIQDGVPVWTESFMLTPTTPPHPAALSTAPTGTRLQVHDQAPAQPVSTD